MQQRPSPPSKIPRKSAKGVGVRLLEDLLADLPSVSLEPATVTTVVPPPHRVSSPSLIPAPVCDKTKPTRQVKKRKIGDDDAFTANSDDDENEDMPDGDDISVYSAQVSEPQAVVPSNPGLQARGMPESAAWAPVPASSTKSSTKAYRESRRARQLAEELEMGYQFEANEIRKMDWWVDLNDEKVEEIAELSSLDPEEIRVYMPEIREFMGTARGMITNEGVLRASNVNGNPNKILHQYMERPSTRQRIRDLFARVEAGERPRSSDTNVASKAHHSVVQTGVSNEC
ncbi:hypothetical protein RhiJN_28809 [Ceratobasidium sp. AG-Ba]|nr:hypothetical protein RhiJN_28809 [Ceratobasidium sp. AG-Ba]